MNDLPNPSSTSSTLPAQPTAPTSLTVADAVEIAQTCSLAGRTDLIAGFLETGVSPAQARSQLLVAQATQSPEIVSRIGPNAAASAAASAANPASPDNPLIQAVKRRMAAHPTQP